MGGLHLVPRATAQGRPPTHCSSAYKGSDCVRRHQALQSHPPDVNIVPSKRVVAKRLAQCLNPSLPSGVHQKALEIYGYIFGVIGV